MNVIIVEENQIYNISCFNLSGGMNIKVLVEISANIHRFKKDMILKNIESYSCTNTSCLLPTFRMIDVSRGYSFIAFKAYYYTF